MRLARQGNAEYFQPPVVRPRAPGRHHRRQRQGACPPRRLQRNGCLRCCRPGGKCVPSRIRSAGNSTTELKLLRLFRKAGVKGWRRNHSLPGKPDFAFPELRVAVFVDGCFWHGHRCGRNLTPSRNAKAWSAKIEGNQKRDRRVSRELRWLGWRVIRIWECSLTKRPNASLRRVRRLLAVTGHVQLVRALLRVPPEQQRIRRESLRQAKRLAVEACQPSERGLRLSCRTA